MILLYNIHKIALRPRGFFNHYFQITDSPQVTTGLLSLKQKIFISTCTKQKQRHFVAITYISFFVIVLFC